MAASGLTFLQIVNRVLERLRETAVADFDESDYSSFISGLVNQVKTEIEEACYWHVMRNTFSVSTTNNTSQYSMTGAGQAAIILSGWNITNGQPLEKGSVAEFDRHFFGVGSSSVQTGSPTEYLQAGLDSGFDIVVDVWPVPITGKLDTLKFTVYTPQADLTDNGTVPLVPQNVLIEEVIARAKLERGDEDALQPDAQSQSGKFIRWDLLSAAVTKDRSIDGDENDWITE